MKEERSIPMKNKKVWIILMACVLVWAAVLGVYLFKNPRSAQPAATEEPETPALSFDTGYHTLSFPEKYEGMIEHVRREEGGVITNLFHLVHKGFRVELFRLMYGDASQGEYIGMLETDDKEVPVSYMVHQPVGDELAHVDVNAYFFELMDDFNDVISPIYADDRFHPGENIGPGISAVSSLKYWNVELPAAISWQENESEGNYRADFFGEVANRKIMLYTVYLGESVPDATVLGKYEVDGVKKDVSVTSSPLNMLDGWTEADMTTAGTLMDTINDVIRMITSSEQFSVE